MESCSSTKAHLNRGTPCTCCEHRKWWKSGIFTGKYSQGTPSSQAQTQFLVRKYLLSSWKQPGTETPTLFLIIHIPVPLNEASKDPGKTPGKQQPGGETPGFLEQLTGGWCGFPCPDPRTHSLLLVPRKRDHSQLPLNHEQGSAEPL